MEIDEMSRFIRLSRKWIPWALKGLLTIPEYLRYWGFLRGSRRLVKFGLTYGIVRLQSELSAVRQLRYSIAPDLGKIEYIIHTPDYLDRSAGVRCLFKLADDLRLLGFHAAVTGCLHCPPDYKVPKIPVSAAKKRARKGAWVIYPETVSGNPLRGKNIVRWVLNRPGLLGGEARYPQNEHVFIYSDVYRAYVTNEVAGKICMPMLDGQLFYPPLDSATRSLQCFYVGKSKFVPGYFKKDEVFEITREAPARSELGKLFRASKTLYCFDNSTALIYEALLCGCPVIVIPDGTQTWSDYQKLELGNDGISWGVPDQAPESFDPRLLQERVNQLNSKYLEQVKFLTAFTQGNLSTRRPANQPADAELS